MSRPLRVVVAGAGVAALEALMALHHTARGDVDLTLLAPERDFVYRPLSATGGFARAAHYRWPLVELAAHAEARVIHDAAVYVDDRERTVLTRDGDWIEFDAMLVAVGARTAHALPFGVAWDRDVDHGALESLVRRIESGARRIAFVVPPGPRWPVPAYELAFAAVATSGGDVEAHLLTAEAAPLDVLGKAATEAVSGELERAGVRVIAGVEVSAERAGALIAGEELLEVDEVVSLPRVAGPRMPGLPADTLGFHATDESCRVVGGEATWAAGDCTDLVVKHSSLAVQQADAAAAAIASAAGVDVEAPAGPPRLRGILAEELLARWESEELGGPHPAGPRTRHSLWWPPTLAAGRRFGAVLARHEPGVRLGAPSYPHGLTIDVEVPHLPRDEGTWPRDSELSRRARSRDAQERKLESIRRLERDARADERTLERELASFDRAEAEVVKRLEREGYLHRRRP